MLKKKKRTVFIWLLLACFLAVQSFFSVPALAEDNSGGTGRLAGADRYETAAAISRQGWAKAETAVLARGDDYADALCAVPLAAKVGGPVLLTPPGRLSQAALDELKRLGVQKLYLIGGPGAISPEVANSLQAQGFSQIERLYGRDRYETAVKIAEKIGASAQIFLATGQDYPDALSASVPAAQLGAPILLPKPTALPPAVAAYLAQNQISRTFLIGGSGAISPAVEKIVPNPNRLAGSDRYATNTAVLNHFDNLLNYRKIYTAIGGGPKGNEFADALTGAVLAAKEKAPRLLTAKVLRLVSAAFLQTRLRLDSRAVAFGGEAAVPTAILREIIAAKERLAVSFRMEKAGTYGPAAGTEEISGDAIICADGVILRNTVIKGDLLLGQSIGQGNVTLQNVTVEGQPSSTGRSPQHSSCTTLTAKQ
jgi:putative cell wall-binding protein